MYVYSYRWEGHFREHFIGRPLSITQRGMYLSFALQYITLLTHGFLPLYRYHFSVLRLTCNVARVDLWRMGQNMIYKPLLDKIKRGASEPDE